MAEDSGHPRDDTVSADADAPADATYRLLERAKGGDREALDILFARHIPTLRRWASGRLPRWARDIADTQDLVQETVLQVFKRVEAFEPRGDGALQAYLRQAVMNRIRNEFRSKGRRPAFEDLDEQAPPDRTSPLEAAIRQEQLDRYDAALSRLSEQERDLIVARVEMGLTYEEMAEALGKPSWNAARMATARALLRLAEELKRGRLTNRSSTWPPPSPTARLWIGSRPRNRSPATRIDVCSPNCDSSRAGAPRRQLRGSYRDLGRETWSHRRRSNPGALLESSNTSDAEHSAMSIGPGTAVSIARSRSRFCGAENMMTRHASRRSFRKDGCWPGFVIPTSSRSTARSASVDRSACGWSSSTARRWNRSCASTDHSTSIGSSGSASTLADALSTVHRAGLIHGDVKTQNVMCASDGRTGADRFWRRLRARRDTGRPSRAS